MRTVCLALSVAAIGVACRDTAPRGAFVPSTSENVSYSGTTVKAALDARALVTFAPGGTAGPGVFTDFGEMAASVAGFGGTLSFECDATHSSTANECTVPAGTYTFATPDMGWTGPVYVPGAVAATSWGFATGVTITPPPKRVTDVILRNKGTTTPFTIASAGIAMTLLTGLAALDAASSAPLIKCDTTTQFCAFSFQDGAALLATGSAAGTIQQLGSGTMFLTFLAQNQASANSIAAPTAAQVAATVGPGFVINPTQNGVLDTHTVTPTFGTNGARMVYSPATARNGTAATVGAGLDAIQRITTTLSSGVSPAVTATITANTRITCVHKTPTGTGIGILSAPSADRSTGASGSFKVRAYTVLNVAETNDNSTVDCMLAD